MVARLPDADRLDHDTRLLLRSVSDPEAFAEFFRRNRDALLAWLYRQTLDAEVAADIAAESFAVVLAKRVRFRATKGAARGWLWGVAAIELRRWRRRGAVAERARRRSGIPILAVDDEAIAHVESLIDLREFVDASSRELEALPGGERAAVELRVLEGLSYDEVARRLNCHPGAARVRVSRGLGKLRTSLAAYDPAIFVAGPE